MSSGDAEAHNDAKLQLLAEELSVTKETLEAGRVRISTTTHEREALIDEDLARERIEIETVPIGRRIDAVPEMRQERDTTIIPVVGEVLVVERRLMLKEENRNHKMNMYLHVKHQDQDDVDNCTDGNHPPQYCRNPSSYVGEPRTPQLHEIV